MGRPRGFLFSFSYHALKEFDNSTRKEFNKIPYLCERKSPGFDCTPTDCSNQASQVPRSPVQPRPLQMGTPVFFLFSGIIEALLSPRGGRGQYCLLAGVKRTLQARQTPGCAVQVVDAHGCNVECCGLTIWLVLRVYAKMNTRIAKHTSRRGDERRQRITLAREGGGHGRVAAPPGAGSFSSHDSASTAATSTAFASALCEVCLAAAMAARAAGAFVRARA